MINNTLKNNLSAILEKPNVIVKKGDISGNSIEVYVNEPAFEDIGSFTYYNNTKNRDTDFTSLTKLINEKNG